MFGATALTMKTLIFRNVTPYRLVNSNQRATKCVPR